MKTSSKIMLVIGILLVVFQIMAYRGNPHGIPSYNDNMVVFAGSLLGFNLIGLVGIILIVIGLSRKGNS